jgi:F5/8 type C domain/Right handed beta helix region
VAVHHGGEVPTEGVKVSARRHLKWRWFLTTALGLSMLSLAALAHVDERTDGDVNETARGGVVLSNWRSLVDMGAMALQGVIYVDANAPGAPDEDGTSDHPFDSVSEAMAVASDGDTILVAPGRYTPTDSSSGRLDFAGRNIQLKSYFEEDFTYIERTVLDATIVFDGTEGPDCELAGFKIQGPAFEGISGNGTAATLRDCVIQGNRTCDGSVLTDFYGAMANCLIADNTSAFECGSRPTVANFGGTMTNCTIVNNATGISVHTADIVNCIFYYNGVQTIRVQDHGSLAVSHCNIQGGEQVILASETETLASASIMALNPRFAKLGVWENGQLEAGDYHLKSQGLRWSPQAVADSHWVRDAITSPCIDSGDPSLDIGAEAVGFPSGMGVQTQVNWRINTGCYGGTAQASLPFVDRVVGITATAASSDEEDNGPEKTCNGSGIDAQGRHSTEAATMWLSDDLDAVVWIQYEFNRSYVLYEMRVWNYNSQFESILGFGVKDVTIEYSENGTDWTVLDDVQFAQAPARADYAANTIVPLGGISAQYVRLEIRSGWGLMGKAGLSEVRFFADLTPHSEPGLSYVLVLDTFETYTASKRIYNVWFDGWMNESGSRVGYLEAPFAERWIVNSGQQAMPLFYDNKGFPSYSEAYRELEAELQDWHVGDAEALTLYFHGSTSQDHSIETDRLYVAVEDDRGLVAVVYHGDPEALLSDDWQEWTIGFEEFGNVDLSHVTRLILGVGNRDNPQLGGSSVVYIDDIGLSAGGTQTAVVYPISDVVATSNAISEEGAEPENTVNGSGLNDNDEHSTKSTDMWLGQPEDGGVYIQFEFDDVYELDEMWVWNYNVMFEFLLGFGIKEATIEYSENGTDWTTLSDVEFAQGTATADYTVGTIVAFGGVPAKYVRLNVQSGWGMLGQFGLSEVRFFTSQVPSSTIWSYTLFLDTFETYTAGADPNTVIDQVWADGWQNGTGAQVGHPPSPFTEREIVNSGLQAMPLFYDNRWSPFYSEAYRDLEAELQDWRAGAADALTLYFHGNADQGQNIEADRLYVAVEDDRGGIAVVHHGDPEALLSDDWQEWTISFEEFGDVDLSHVKRLIVGVGDRNDPQPGGHSVVYIDDIGLSARVLETDAGQ